MTFAYPVSDCSADHFDFFHWAFRDEAGNVTEIKVLRAHRTRGEAS